MRGAILGVGSLGTVLGASIANNGGDVTLIDANREHVEAMQKNGATIDGHLDLKNVPVCAITPDQMEGVYDIVIVLLKQTANKKALTHLLNYLNEDSVVLTLQNGLPEEYVSDIIGASRTLSGTVAWTGLFTGPGKSRLVTDKSTFFVDIGTLDGSATPKLEAAAEFLRLGCGVNIHSNLIGVRWTKLLVNAALSGMSAATGSTMGEVVDDDQAVLCAVHTADEVNRVAGAKGIKLEMLYPGYDFTELKFDTEDGRQKAVEFARSFWGPHGASRASMLNDMEWGIPCEIDYINGEVSKWGNRLNIETPFNDEIVHVIKDFEAKKIPFPTLKSSVWRFNIPKLPK